MKNKYIVSFSGGKDSTALLLMLLEKRMTVDEIVYFDFGVDFPEIVEHMKDVERITGRKITRLTGEHDFRYFLCDYERKRGDNKSLKGLGFPDMRRRWCTTYKIKIIESYLEKKYDDCNIVEYHGIAADEMNRAKKNKTKNRTLRYPLIDWGITEKMALEYCYSKGLSFGGLYKYFDRISCWCCPLTNKGNLFSLYRYYPKLWQELRVMQSNSYRKFRATQSVFDLEREFEKKLELGEKNE